MDAERSLLILFADKLFPQAISENRVATSGLSRWVEPAKQELARKIGDSWDAFSPKVRDGLAADLERLLAQLRLLDAGPAILRKAAESWVDAHVEMLLRLKTDWSAIEDRFCAGHALGALAGVATGISDRHERGRSVAILQFDSGLRLVYKPREFEIEEWFLSLLDQLNRLGTPLPFYRTVTLSRQAYGWMQHLPHVRCPSKAGLSNYYKNAGALLCMLYLLSASDCHFQNLIACGEYPVMVDAETLFQPGLTPEQGSIEQVGMLPTWHFGPAGEAYDVSALGCVDSRDTHFQVPHWISEGVELQPGILAPTHNVPFPSDMNPAPEDYSDEVIEGFSRTYRFLAGQRPFLLAQADAAAKLTVRYVVRETMEYYVALNQALRSRRPVETLLSTLPESRAAFHPLRQSEAAALEQLDIPRFSLPAGSRSLPGLENCFAISGLERAGKRITALSEVDLAQLVQSIRLSWALYRASLSLS